MSTVFCDTCGHLVRDLDAGLSEEVVGCGSAEESDPVYEYSYVPELDCAGYAWSPETLDLFDHLQQPVTARMREADFDAHRYALSQDGIVLADVRRRLASDGEGSV